MMQENKHFTLPKGSQYHNSRTAGTTILIFDLPLDF